MATSIRQQEQEAASVMASLSPEVLGDRLRRARMRQGRSIRELADAAGLSKSSIVRLEQGGGTYPMTIVKVCAALGHHVARLRDSDTAGDERFAVHRLGDDRWYDMMDFGAGALGADDRALNDAERAALVREKGIAVPLVVLASRLSDGRLLSNVMEIYAKSDPRSHSGEEFIFVLSGTATITIGDTPVTITAGESLVFRSIEPHTYEPAEGSAVPVRVVMVRLDDRPPAT
ncbi:MAG: helix-turn-helix transcriptional regulator [Gemmatimonadaceae bacterium]|nr:helix-turn-helix transcriptional regulator [Gemmatimonadaceae bacterium]